MQDLKYKESTDSTDSRAPSATFALGGNPVRNEISHQFDDTATSNSFAQSRRLISKVCRALQSRIARNSLLHFSLCFVSFLAMSFFDGTTKYGNFP